MGNHEITEFFNFKDLRDYLVLNIEKFLLQGEYLEGFLM